MAEKAIELAQYARTEINQIARPVLLRRRNSGRQKRLMTMIRRKLTIHVRHLGITGYETENWLREHYNIEIEMSDMYNILCLVTPGDTLDYCRSLLECAAPSVREPLRSERSA